MDIVHFCFRQTWISWNVFVDFFIYSLTYTAKATFAVVLCNICFLSCENRFVRGFSVLFSLLLFIFFSSHGMVESKCVVSILIIIYSMRSRLCFMYFRKLEYLLRERVTLKLIYHFIIWQMCVSILFCKCPFTSYRILCGVSFSHFDYSIHLAFILYFCFFPFAFPLSFLLSV